MTLLQVSRQLARARDRAEAQAVRYEHLARTAKAEAQAIRQAQLALEEYHAPTFKGRKASTQAA